MPLFKMEQNQLHPLEQSNFGKEKVLQDLIEKNLQVAFNCRFIASEFPTGDQHGGRIDTLALSEENNPVIIEYKKKESSELINQSLFYLSWIYDHRGDFEIAAQGSLGSNIDIDWSDVRVICLAPNYRRYDLFAVEVMGTNIELWTYRLYRDGFILLEEVGPKKYSPSTDRDREGKDPVMVAAGKKAAITRATQSFAFEDHTEGKPEWVIDLAYTIQEFILGIDPSIEENPRKMYVGYRTSQNIVCMEIQNQKIYLLLKLDSKLQEGPPGISRDVSKIGHYGTGDIEVSISSMEDFEVTKPFIEMAYQYVG